MKLKGGTCPKCGSTETIKEKIMGQDTLDIICLKCKYVGHWSEFHPKPEAEDKKEKD